jgi:hypothetical protein
MLRAYIAGIGVWSPSLPSWGDCSRRLLGAPAGAAGNKLPPADWLPPVERRRATLSTRVVLSVAREALAQAGWDASTVPSILASSSGSPDITNDLCSSLAAGDTQISPTRFHNSVHNAAAGYYSIAVACRAASTTLGAHDASAAAGLLEAGVLLAVEATSALFVAFDVPYTGPLADVRPIADPFGVAFALAPQPAPGQVAALTLHWSSRADVAETTCEDAGLEYTRGHNPSARLLPLLALLAAGRQGEVVLATSTGGRLRVEAAPC